MSRPRWSLVPLFLLIAAGARAQTRIDAGLSLGRQSYAAHEESPRYLPGIELLLRRGSLGGHLAAEYADIGVADGPLVAIHADVVHRIGSDGVVLMLGAGPTYIIRNSPKDLVWNAEAEVSYAFGRTDLFARLRHYDYELKASRFGNEAGPNGPAVYLGVRFKLRE